MVMHQGRRNNLSTTRDLSKPLLVIDGPDQGDWRAWPKDSFVSVTVWDSKRVSEQPPPVTYRLRHHARQGLVWASGDEADLSDPAQA